MRVLTPATRITLNSVLWLQSHTELQNRAGTRGTATVLFQMIQILKGWVAKQPLGGDELRHRWMGVARISSVESSEKMALEKVLDG